MSPFKLFLTTIIVAFFALGANSRAAAILDVNGSGILTGAQNVDVNGTLYDVQFADGTCAALFGGCTSASDFAFNSFDDALAAAHALASQVLIDDPTHSFAFDSTPSLVNGCSFFVSCTTYVPFAAVGAYVDYAWYDDFYHPLGDHFPTGTTFDLITTDTSASGKPGIATNWAVFSPAAAATAVPEPGSLALFGGALMSLLIIARWRRN
jgi:PEP-CTERM motif